ncbi:MAG TPA: RlpA-like double-psi beta-barrel domain-containing protein [Dehalococcoidia bacterium]|nr:RlpA-like double-psi beta-barrel domain-containing protein [Dehalococcoidia bacterium]
MAGEPAFQPEIGATSSVMSRLLSVLSTLRERVPLEEPADTSYTVSGWITHYSDTFNKRTLGCFGYGQYSSDDPSIIAVNPTLYKDLPCGSIMELCGPGGCVVAARKDSCPGCRPDGFDLSDAGFRQVCGDADGVCTASVKVVKVCEARSFGKSREEGVSAQAPENLFPPPVPCQHPPF